MKDILYCLLIIVAILGYTISVPVLPQLYLFHIIFFLFLFGLLLSIFLKGKIKLKIKNVKFYLVFFVIWFTWILISFFWIEDLSLAIKFSFIYLMMFIFTWTLIFCNQDENFLKKTLKILFYISLTALFIGTLEAFTDFRLPVSPYLNLNKYSADVAEQISSVPTSFFYNPNNYATFLAIILPFIFFAYKYFSSNEKKIIFILSTLLIVINIIVTGSRINILSLIFVTFFYLFFFLTRKFSFEKVVKYFLLFLVVIPIFFFLLNNNDLLKTRFESAIYAINNIFSEKESLDKGGSVFTRITITKEILWPSSALNYIRGFGVGNSRAYFEQKNVTGKIVDPHNWWLEVLGEFGLIFFLFYVIFFASLLKKLWIIMKRKDNPFVVYISSSCFFSLLAFIFSSMSPSSVVYFFPHWILIGISLVVINLFFKKHEDTLSY